MKISNAFQTFLSQAPDHAHAWMKMIQELDEANGLDKKNQELAFLAVLAATRLTSGIPFHVLSAKDAGARREEIISAVLIGLPAVGNVVIESLAVALDAYDGKER